jgi:hypothetical protein
MRLRSGQNEVTLIFAEGTDKASGKCRFSARCSEPRGTPRILGFFVLGGSIDRRPSDCLHKASKLFVCRLFSISGFREEFLEVKN